MRGYQVLCLFLIFTLYQAKAQSGIENTNANYDIGCYRRRVEFSDGDILASLRNGEMVPSCVQGGLWRPYQCGFYNCSCVYLDTGNVISEIVTTDISTEEIESICPNRAEEIADGCIRAPLMYPCRLGNTKYWFNNDTQSCEEAAYGCYGFETSKLCEETCVPEEVNERVTIVEEVDIFEELEVDVSVQSRYLFRVRAPRYVIDRYQLDLDSVNEMEVEAFVNLTNSATSLRLIEDKTSTTTPKPTTPATTPTTPATTPTTAATTPTTGAATTQFQEPMEIVARRLGNAQDICKLPTARGPCRGFFPRWYFDPSVSRCRRFTYGGCLPNGNNFVQSTECGRYCGARNPPSADE